MAKTDPEDTADAIPWHRHMIVGAVLFLLIISFQQLSRGEITVSIALVAAGGFVLVSELVRRRGP